MRSLRDVPCSFHGNLGYMQVNKYVCTYDSIAFKALISQLIYGETVERHVTKGLTVLIAPQQ